MRKILLLLCILSITIGAKAQLFGKSWKEGAYYDSDGVKHAGLVLWTPPQLSLSFVKDQGDNIHFKKDKKGEDVEIKSSDLISFIMKIDDETIDSFIVSKNKMFTKAPFLKVEIANDIKLYSWMTKRQSYAVVMANPSWTPMARAGEMAMIRTEVPSLFDGKTTYFFGSDPKNVTELDKKNFVETMSKIMANKPEAIARIKSKKLRYGDMEDLLYFYKYDVMPPAPAPDPFSGLDH